jgi:hypothetical protein
VVTRGTAPPKRGYHKSVLVGNTMYIIGNKIPWSSNILFSYNQAGGSDGSDAFSDVHMLDTGTPKKAPIKNFKVTIQTKLALPNNGR